MSRSHAHGFSRQAFFRKDDAYEARGWRTEKRSVAPQQPDRLGGRCNFIVAAVAVVIFYNGRDIRDLTTTSNPNSAPSVTTGAKRPVQP
jgi:hypothetical protein